jgi:hypothetical protein
MMLLVYGFSFGGSLAGIAAWWLLVGRAGGKHLAQRMTAHVSRSAALERQCATTIGYQTAAGRL